MPSLKLYSENFFVVHKAFHKKRCKIIAVIMTIKCIPHLDYYYSYFTLTIVHCKNLAHKVNFKQINFAFGRSKDCRRNLVVKLHDAVRSGQTLLAQSKRS